MTTAKSNADRVRSELAVRRQSTRCALMRTLAACLCQLALLVCLAPLPTTGSEEQTGEMEEGIAKVIDRRSSPEIAARERPAGRLGSVPAWRAISADRATLAATRHALPGHVLPNGLRAPLRC